MTTKAKIKNILLANGIVFDVLGKDFDGNWLGQVDLPDILKQHWAIDEKQRVIAGKFEQKFEKMPAFNLVGIGIVPKGLRVHFTENGRL